jgi:hypothetical protein
MLELGFKVRRGKPKPAERNPMLTMTQLNV